MTIALAGAAPKPLPEAPPPAVRHFEERLSSDDALEKDSTNLWTPGRPDSLPEILSTDTVDMTVFYYLPDGSAVEYDLLNNCYRIFILNQSPKPAPPLPR